MVILTAGASHAGKTVLVQRMLGRYGVPYLSIGHLKMGLIRSGNTDLTPDDDDALTEYLWPIVREMVKTAIENGQNLVVEGCYVPPRWRRDFEEECLRSIESVCLAMSDAYINAHIGETREHACAVGTRLDDSGCTLGALREDNRRCIDAFAECNEKVTIIESDFESTIEAVLDAVHPRWSSLQSA